MVAAALVFKFGGRILEPASSTGSTKNQNVAEAADAPGFNLVSMPEHGLQILVPAKWKPAALNQSEVLSYEDSETHSNLAISKGAFDETAPDIERLHTGLEKALAAAYPINQLTKTKMQVGRAYGFLTKGMLSANVVSSVWFFTLTMPDSKEVYFLNVSTAGDKEASELGDKIASSFKIQTE